MFGSWSGDEDRREQRRDRQRTESEATPRAILVRDDGEAGRPHRRGHGLAAGGRPDRRDARSTGPGRSRRTPTAASRRRTGASCSAGGATSRRRPEWLPGRMRRPRPRQPSARRRTRGPGRGAHETTIAEGPLTDWDARWDETGTRLAVWVADADDPSVGKLSLYVVDPFDGSIDLANPPLEDEPALAGFSIDDGRLAWAAPPDGVRRGEPRARPRLDRRRVRPGRERTRGRPARSLMAAGCPPDLGRRRAGPLA